MNISFSHTFLFAGFCSPILKKNKGYNIKHYLEKEEGTSHQQLHHKYFLGLGASLS
jgi:hypothetical protein